METQNSDIKLEDNSKNNDEDSLSILFTDLINIKSIHTFKKEIQENLLKTSKIILKKCFDCNDDLDVIITISPQNNDELANTTHLCHHCSVNYSLELLSIPNKRKILLKLLNDPDLAKELKRREKPISFNSDFLTTVNTNKPVLVKRRLTKNENKIVRKLMKEQEVADKSKINWSGW
ncbi:MAG: hypothetical protein ACXAC7_04745 [Candidatus Hodarchaeales archaeon]